VRGSAPLSKRPMTTAAIASRCGARCSAPMSSGVQARSLTSAASVFLAVWSLPHSGTTSGRSSKLCGFIAQTFAWHWLKALTTWLPGARRAICSASETSPVVRVKLSVSTGLLQSMMVRPARDP
jgi:hypothetical protein